METLQLGHCEVGVVWGLHGRRWSRGWGGYECDYRLEGVEKQKMNMHKKFESISFASSHADGLGMSFCGMGIRVLPL